MKHAKLEDLVTIGNILEQIRSIEGLTEKTPGHFYFRGRNVLHFHTDSGEIYADICDERLRITDLTKYELPSHVIKCMERKS